MVKSVNSMLVGVFGPCLLFLGMEDGRGGVFWLWSKRKTVGTNAQKSKETPFSLKLWNLKVFGRFPINLTCAIYDMGAGPSKTILQQIYLLIQIQSNFRAGERYWNHQMLQGRRDLLGHQTDSWGARCFLVEIPQWLEKAWRFSEIRLMILKCADSYWSDNVWVVHVYSLFSFFVQM